LNGTQHTMGAAYSIELLTDGLAHCDKNVLKHVLGQPASEIKAIYQRFQSERHGAQAGGGGDDDSSPHAIMEDTGDFARLFGSSKRGMKHWTVLFNTLDTSKNGKVDFFEAIATLVSCKPFTCIRRVVHARSPPLSPLPVIYAHPLFLSLPRNIFQTVTSRASALTKCRMLFQMFDFDNDQHMHRAELLLMLRAAVEGVSKISHQRPPHAQTIEQLVSQAISSTSISSAHPNHSLSYTELSHWMRSNKSVKSFLAAISPSAIHHARNRPQKTKHRPHARGGTRKTSAATPKDVPKFLTRTAADRVHALHVAAEIHRRHVMMHIEACQRLKSMYDEMDTKNNNNVSLKDFALSLPASLRDQSASMFRALSNGRYLHFEQLLHECYPTMTHGEINMMKAATRQVNSGRDESAPVQLSADQIEEMCAIFDMYDTDHSGNMTVTELTAAMSATGVFSKEECQRYFHQASHTAGHHTLTKADFVHFFQDGFITSEAQPLSRLHEGDLAPLSEIHAPKTEHGVPIDHNHAFEFK
jgi:Ca2+-binding EF-hand superfamily protein